MKNVIFILCAFLCLNALGHSQTGKKKEAVEPISITADGGNRFEAGMAYASDNVVVKYQDDIVYADEIAYNTKTKEVTAIGNVRIFTKGRIYRSDQLTYNFETRQIVSSSFDALHDRVYASGTEMLTPRPDKYVIEDGSFTTENRENPTYKLNASTVEIYPNDRVVLKNAILYVGSVPVMWVPYYAYSLNQNRSSFDITPGSNTRWGMYALTSYNWQTGERWSGALKLDYRSKRGLGGGMDFNYRPKQGYSNASFKSFWIHDDGNDINVGSDDRPIEPPARRFRFNYKHSAEIASDIYSIADFNVWSDKHVTEDFFPSEFQKDRQPDNTIDLMYYNPNFTMTLLGRGQINDLFEVSERKPAAYVEIARQQIPYTPLYYEGESSMVNFEKRYDENDPWARTPYRSVRYDSFHQILYPQQYFGWLSLTPLMGIRGTVYNRNNNPNNSDPTGDLSRWVFNTGLEASFKASKTWLDTMKPTMGIQGLRHIVEPFVNFSYVRTPNEEPSEFLGYDNRLATTKATPLNFTAYNSIDSIGKVLTLRHGMRNKIQTKRDGESVDLVDWLVFADLDMERESWAYYEDPDTGNAIRYNQTHPYSQVYSELAIYPLPWLRLDVDSSIGLHSDSFNEVDTTLTWQVHPAVEVQAGYRMIDNVPFFNDSNLITEGTFWRLNENWRVGQQAAFEADDGTLQEHRYSLYRDLTAWNMAVTTAFRNNEDIKDEFLLYFTLTLKAFPEQSLSLDY